MSGRSVNLTTLSWADLERNESMWPDWVSNSGPLTYESGALPTALRNPAKSTNHIIYYRGGRRVHLSGEGGWRIFFFFFGNLLGWGRI